jgi:sigma-B regulation protein RsbU (phosphoserine phosphatase)
MSLFLMVIDPINNEVKWVRAGHDPALIYDPADDSFEELMGEGISLGVDETWSFKEYVFREWTEGKVLLAGTDGVWETENPDGELFGKDRLREVIRRYGSRTSAEIIRCVNRALTDFRQTAPQKDDITLVVLKRYL